MSDIDAYYERLREISKERAALKARHTMHQTELDELYRAREAERGVDQYAVYQIGRDIHRLESILEGIERRIEQLDRLTEGV